YDAADPHLFGSAPWREARDQRGVHDRDRGGRGGDRRGVAGYQAVGRPRARGPAGSAGGSVSGAGGRPRDGRAGGQPRFIGVDRETITPAPVLPYGPAG